MANDRLTINTPQNIFSIVNLSNGSAKIGVSWKTGFGQTATLAFQKAQTELSVECLRLCEKYTPKDTSMLISSANLASKPDDGELIWNTPYASAQYYSKRSTGSQTGALRGPHWGERMKADNLEHLKSFVKTRVKGV